MHKPLLHNIHYRPRAADRNFPLMRSTKNLSHIAGSQSKQQSTSQNGRTFIVVVAKVQASNQKFTIPSYYEYIAEEGSLPTP
jgi:hypothetical protein